MTTLTAAIVANFISLNVFGVHPSLNLGNDQRFPMEYYGYVVLLGIILAIFGLAYHRLTLAFEFTRRFSQKWHRIITVSLPL